MIKLKDTKNEIIDSVSMSYEDSFTLETFQDMIETCHDQGKSFILARVSTVDPKNPEKAFYSYYNAYQLNKVLFQTQIIKGRKYIHRLHVLNPLSNLDIVGDVLYFQVKPGKVIKSKDQSEDIIPSDSAVNVDAKSPAKWTLAGPVISPLSEEFPNDFQVSKDKAYTYPFVRPMQMVRVKDTITIDMAEVNNPDVSSPGKRALVSVQERKISIIPKGAVTQFNTPISDKLPIIKKGNRRAYSWMNTNNYLKQQLSIDEWKVVAQKYQKSNQDDDYDQVDSSTKEEVQDNQPIQVEYEAVLFATDNDYLESPKIRGHFKSNAMSPEDTKLFEMPSVEDVSPVRFSIDDIRGK